MSQGRLAGKIVLVTGGGSEGDGSVPSIGRAIATLFAREGAKVAVVDIDRGRADHTCAAIVAEGGTAFALAGDVTDDATCGRVVADTLEQTGTLDALVNNVGIEPVKGLIEDLDIAAWDRVLAVNLRAAALMCKHALPALVANGGGSVLNITSIGGLRSSGGNAYGPSKAALVQLGRDVAVQYGRHGIRVNAIAPGHVWTPMGEATAGPEQRERRRLIGPLGIEGTAWDVAWAAVFLTSDEARFVNGVCLPVDGGVIETMPVRAAAWLQG